QFSSFAHAIDLCLKNQEQTLSLTCDGLSQFLYEALAGLIILTATMLTSTTGEKAQKSLLSQVNQNSRVSFPDYLWCWIRRICHPGLYCQRFPPRRRYLQMDSQRNDFDDGIPSISIDTDQRKFHGHQPRQSQRIRLGQ
ncbi:hypothetical protein GJAV_G00274670, partial [Gymnothorax javanicus]